jgi:hypothetical protein
MRAAPARLQTQQVIERLRRDPRYPLRLRPLEATRSDRMAATRLFQSCVPADRIRRAGTINGVEAASWLVPDWPDGFALGAVTESGQLAGVATACRLPNQGGQVYELGVIVAPQWRRLGAATTLLGNLALSSLIDATLVAVVESDNLAGVGLLKHMSETEDCESDGHTYSVRVRTDVPSPRVSADLSGQPHHDPCPTTMTRVKLSVDHHRS